LQTKTITIIFCALALIGSLFSIILETPVFMYPTAFMIFATLLLLILKKSLLDEKREEEKESNHKDRENIELKKQIDNLEVRIETIEKEKLDYQEKLHSIFNNFQLFKHSSPVMENLSRLVIDKSEASVNQTTESIFAIAETSKEVGENIQQMLNELSKGEKSLTETVKKLLEEVKHQEPLIKDYISISKSYNQDMKIIEQTVKTINEFTSTITDLSERTGILAINASIETARVGERGKGFSVIAEEVQKLAAHSKEIATQINQRILLTAEKVDESFEKNSNYIQKSISMLETSRDSLKSISSLLDSQVNMIVGSVEESRKLSGTLTDRLNNLIVSFQYQDITRRVLEHMLEILEEIKMTCKLIFDKMEKESPVDSTRYKERIKEIAVKYLTVREEWDVLGIDFDEYREAETTRRVAFKGDVTLF